MNGLADQPRYSFSPAVTCAQVYEGSFVEEMAIILFTSTALRANVHDTQTIGATEMKQKVANSP